MRPVAAPHQPVGVGRDQRARQRLQPIEAVVEHAAKMAGRQLDVHRARAHGSEQRGEVGMVGRRRRVRAAVVVEHHGKAERREQLAQGRAQGQSGMDLQVPAAALEPARSGAQQALGLERRRAIGLEVQAHPAHAAGREPVEFGVRRVRQVDRRHAARHARPERGDRMKQGPVVDAVDARLHDHDARQPGVAQMLVQHAHIGQAGRVDALRTEGKRAGIREHVRVAVARTVRHGAALGSDHGSAILTKQKTPARRPATAQSATRFPCTMTFFQRLNSEAMKVPNSAGVVVVISAPMSLILAFMSGISMISLSVLLSLAMTAGGVLAGAAMPSQPLTS
jgi:hypothetical protein